MERIAKDDFIQGFVPHHNHGSVDYTSVEDWACSSMSRYYFPSYPNGGWESHSLHGRICAI